MKKPLLFLALIAALPLQLRADTIAQWNFNSNPPDASSSTGSSDPSVGAGTATLVGGATATFASGDTVNDPVTDNTGWNTATYPAQGAGNKTRGIQFLVSTAGKENIVISFSQRASNTASKYSRLQYTTNGTDYIDYTSANVLGAGGNVFELKTIDLTGFAGVNNNPNFGFRIVTEFESTATGSGTAGYVTTTASTYGASGTLRYDAVIVSGSIPNGGNTPPAITGMTNQTIRESQSATNFFTIGDAETPLNSLTLSAGSSNAGLVPTGNITFAGTGADRSVIVTPVAGQIGTATITVTVTDGGGAFANSAFTLTVLVANTAPTITAITRTNSLMDTASPALPFTVNDAETSPGSLTLSATSSDTTLLPVSNIVFGGSGTDRTVTLTPAAGQTGAAAVTVTVSDGTNSASSTFNYMVVPSSSVVFYEPFNHADGSLRTNSGSLWNTRAGTAGQLQVTSGKIVVTSANSEDVSGPLIGAPVSLGNGTVLYASFKVNFSALPTGGTGDLFAHFANGSNLRGRIYASTANAAPGSFRLRVANNSNTNVELPQDLNTGTTYTVVTRYTVDTPATTIWVNPTAESDAGASASDSATGLAINSYDFREDTGIGTMTVDDLKVGTSFAAVAGGSTPPPAQIPLSVSYSGGNVTLTWSNPVFTLQAAPEASGTYTNVPGAGSPYTTSATGAAKFFRLKF